MKEEDEQEEQLSEETEEEVAEAMEEAEAEEKLEDTLEEEIAEEAVEAEEAPVPAEEEEAKPRKKKKEEEEEEIVEERFYTIPLSKAWLRPPNKRAPRAMHMIRAFIARHMKLETYEEEEEEYTRKLVIKNDVNEKVWSRGIEKPPRKIRVRATKDTEGNITVYLAEG